MTITEHILKEYAARLDREEIPYSNVHGFSVEPQTNIYIRVVGYEDGTIYIWGYVGMVYDTGMRNVRHFIRDMKPLFPDCAFTVDRNEAAEIDIGQRFPFGGIDDLHERVLKLAAAVAESSTRAQETFGAKFGR